MGYELTWLLLSFAIMVVGVLVNPYERIERIDRELDCLELRELHHRPAAAPDAITGAVSVDRGHPDLA